MGFKVCKRYFVDELFMLTLHCQPVLPLRYALFDTAVFSDTATLHVWLCNWRGIAVSDITAWSDWLDAAETHRARSYRFADDQTRYIVSHGILRYLLGQYCQTDPKTLSFTYNDREKPFLKHQPAFWQFSMAHSGDWVAIAIGKHTAIGIDIETLNQPHIDWQTISKAYFSTSEQAWLDTTTQPDAVFSLIWTRKEAILKATGAGLSEDMRYIEVGDGTHALVAPFQSPYHRQTQTLYVQTLQGDGFYSSIAQFTPLPIVVFDVAAGLML